MFPAELAAVFGNLLTNAVKAAGSNGRICASAVDGKKQIQVRIQNTGTAVKLSEAERWFKPFQSTTSEVDPVLGQGMGLGLPIVRNLLEYYGGDIKFGPRRTNRTELQSKSPFLARINLEMTEVERPSILVVDDEPDTLRDEMALRMGDRATGNVVHPHDVKISHLEHADLVLVDYRLEKWEERDKQAAISLRPATGTALSALLREHVDRSERDRLTAFALHSGHLEDIQGRLPAVAVQHVIARLNNLEWAFPKTEPRRYDQMISLANAVRQLPRRWAGWPRRFGNGSKTHSWDG